MDIFTTWLLTDWGPPHTGGIFYTGKDMNCMQLQALQELRPRHAGVRRLVAGSVWLAQNSEHATAYPMDRTVTFDLVPLGPDRVEVKMEFSATLPGFLQFLAELLNKIGKRWPSMWETLEGAFGAQSVEVPAADTTKPAEAPAVGKTKQERIEYRRKRVADMRNRTPKTTIEDIAEQLGCSQITVTRDMRALGIK